tara:strand:- start:500 stop:1003 length:504 start_codon:yes stop_codon:yes gene_type:complete
MSAYLVNYDTINLVSKLLVEDKTINLITDLFCYGYKQNLKASGPIEPRQSGGWSSKLAIELKRMNLKALEARYPANWQELTEHQGIKQIDIETEDGEILPGFEVFDDQHPYGETLPQKLKHVQCFLYQCNEGDVPNMPLFKAVERLADEMKNVIINELASYQEATWE